MGNCCTWKSGNENKNEINIKESTYSFDNNITTLLNHDKTSVVFKLNLNYFDEKEKYPEYITKKEALLSNIGELISENNNNKVSTINIESLWNITKFYKQDFTQSNFILFDLRKKEFKTENFFKKFKCINYNINEIQAFSGNKLRTFKNFIRNKMIIIIPKSANNDLKKVSNFINTLNEETISQHKFLILSDVINLKPTDTPPYLFKYKLYTKIDDRDFEIYPNILFPLNEIKYLNNDNYIYISNKEHAFNNNEIINSYEYYLNNKDFINFILNLRIKIILDIDENYIETKVFYKKHAVNVNNKIEEILYIKSNKEGYKNINNELKHLFLNTRLTFLSQGGLLIFFNDKVIERNCISKWISIILVNNFFIFNEEDSILTESEILINAIKKMTPLYFDSKFLEEVLIVDIDNYYSSKDYINEELNNDNTLYQNLKNLFIEKSPNKTLFLEIICIFEKILLNILLNPYVDKYYKIKKSSKTISNMVLNSEYSYSIFQDIGFNIDDKNEFYIISKDTDLNALDDLRNTLIYSVNKILSENVC